MLDPKNGFKPLPQTSLNGKSITVLRLHEDSIAALGWMLNIIHFQTENVPRTVSREDMLAIAILCDKYLWQRAVGLWLEKWVTALLPTGDGSGISDNTETAGPFGIKKEDISKEGCEDWLFLARVFPNISAYTSYHLNVFNRLVEEIVGDMESFEDANRMLKWSAVGEKVMLPVVFDLVPDATFATIREIRNETFTSAISEITSILLDIETFKPAFGNRVDQQTQTNCQGKTECHEVTLSSSVGASIASQPGWDIEATYCPSCIRGRICLWVLWDRVAKLREVLESYVSTQRERGRGARVSRAPGYG
ncbi:hypothetical protein TWF718_000086 [Orbilia javanica]|uniref:Uncharacterized protein n=1 Tax=Orbilia javanica TaxID=47235 RepID=A0AAN8RLQ9_9PEZI